MITIRTFADSDAEAVASIIATTMRASNSRDYTSDVLEPLIAYFTPAKLRSLAAKRVCLVAELEERIVGTGALDGNELATFFVLPAFQLRGIGSRLLDALESSARAAGYRQVSVQSSLTSSDFYERRGYTRRGPPVEHSAGPQIPMLKELAPE